MGAAPAGPGRGMNAACTRWRMHLESARIPPRGLPGCPRMPHRARPGASASLTRGAWAAARPGPGAALSPPRPASSWLLPATNRPDGPSGARPAAPGRPAPRRGPTRESRAALRDEPAAPGRPAPRRGPAGLAAAHCRPKAGDAPHRRQKRLKATSRGMRRRANAVWCAGRFLAGAGRVSAAVRRRGGGRGARG